ncbi:MAG: SDR family oxidoreductase, partial [Candidatus Theseobacter exili]|nr:SDR family oxidoreductase [Candidatus Theseobacter exili]
SAKLGSTASHSKTKQKIKKSDINDAKLCIRKAFFEATGQYACINFFFDETIAANMKQISSAKNPEDILTTSPINPDELVYANGSAMWVPKCDCEQISQKFKKQISLKKKPSLGFLVKGLGLFIVAKPTTASVIRDILSSSMNIRINASKLGGLICLNKRQEDFIANWEAEAFRKAVASVATTGSQELKDRIAVVTGAGSGLGRSIAIGMARAGAMVGLADIDQNGALETAEIIANELPSSSTIVLNCNVTDEKNVDNVFESLINNWGGLDILVNAAGVAPAFALTNLPLDKWRFALEVNLTGYFLMARAASRIMIKQDMGGAIVNISSKSGIDASKNNTPYNATKAGELHMGRGWAMELGTHNIRVNSVCPGNVFEGSKIWNPEYIKICAKKYGIKPEEVIPYYITKTMLNREIKGQDIADSVVFLSSDKARRITAQTLVVDAGQAMVR